jgi:uncharacterized protein YdaU (DUF1376 family)
MSARPWMPFFVGDYRADTQHLSTAQHGYLLLIMHYWQHGGLPDDDEQLARIVGMTAAEWRKNRPAIRAFFGDGWRHARIEREIATASEKYQRRIKAAKRGNEVRWGSRNAIRLGSQSQPQSQSHYGNRSQGEEASDVEDDVVLRRQVRGPALLVVSGSAANDGGMEDEQ